MSSIRMRTLRALGKQAVKQNLWNLRKRSDLFQTQRLLGHAISTDKAHMETSAEKARAHPVVRKVLGTAEKLGEGTGERRSSGPCRSVIIFGLHSGFAPKGRKVEQGGWILDIYPLTASPPRPTVHRVRRIEISRYLT
ncbi:hypothetical protein, variant 2 [Blastomyces dermatitidis ER-3]|uniref:Uncharacterized protein n=3 Tax=Blastomyces TaxID=229219 RepID=A0A179UNN9_BLAGS|nr:uncharacterized protein BDBG_05223 [Blastomyces gilchristii SLH14081]XP_031578826.1 hypothetical protein, variant 1 [Blastomyces gilchristii SLH14081]XP_031578827.1 hypothetical protein, variant 2 [Blastomyces gilchristii SLH14081]XP_045278046.1 hypothetical protein, variant 1 [Blastomyces dermatitidis ER-3]XP_045281783.1 uncharacterized protein BDCG_06650 [Blastomyces dermatitidis ER-3]XP_045281784.1 hypothetical protein, variant 2 [Blastomyces dermatitidis ER-3]EGE80415.1 hypothetical pr